MRATLVFSRELPRTGRGSAVFAETAAAESRPVGIDSRLSLGYR
jgi:hypothetical protein